MEIGGGTRIFGVVGDPVKQVKTPTHINAIFERRAVGIVCMPFHVSVTDFASYWDGVKGIKNVVGFGVTIPHKRQAMELCDSLGAGAKRTGVVNVVRRRLDGGFHGENFDGLSFVKGLIAQGFDLRGQNVFMTGAGGAATAISFALLDAGINSLSIHNRTSDKAVNLMTALRDGTGASNVRVVSDFIPSASLVINATSLGMEEDDALPVDPDQLDSTQIVAEVVAKPEITKLLRAAESIGCPIHSGIHMITNQMDIMADFITGDQP